MSNHNVVFREGFVIVSTTWTALKTYLSSKKIFLQYEEFTEHYLLFALDGSILYMKTIYTGTVPDGENQSQNDADKSDFETNYKPTANKPIGQKSLKEQYTYTVEVEQNGAANKFHMIVFNPTGSGKIVKVRRFWMYAPGNAGNVVLIYNEFRRITGYTGGTTLTPVKWDTSDPSSAAECKSVPTTVTEPADNVFRMYGTQTNTVQAPDTVACTLNDGNTEIKPVILRPGEGFLVKQITSATANYRMGILYTEEDL